MIEFDVQFQNAQNMDVSFSESDTFSCSMDGVIVSDYPGPYEVEPTENTQSLITSGKILASDIIVDAIPSDYVGSNIPHRSSDDLTASGDTVTAPAGYYDEVASKPIAHGSAKTPDSTISVNPSISVNSAGLITATVSKNITITPTVTPGGYAIKHEYEIAPPPELQYLELSLYREGCNRTRHKVMDYHAIQI